MQSEAPSIAAILVAGRSLLEANQPSQVTMASVAAASGYSRMAVYRHFGSRAGLLTALLAHIDDVEGADAAVREILRAPTGPQVVEGLFDWWAGYVARFAGVARGVLVTKHADPDLQDAWTERMRDLRRVCDAVSERCFEDRRRSVSYADQLWALMSVPLWIQLADDGWTRDRYAQALSGLALAALADR